MLMDHFSYCCFRHHHHQLLLLLLRVTTFNRPNNGSIYLSIYRSVPRKNCLENTARNMSNESDSPTNHKRILSAMKSIQRDSDIPEPPTTDDLPEPLLRFDRTSQTKWIRIPTYIVGKRWWRRRTETVSLLLLCSGEEHYRGITSSISPPQSPLSFTKSPSDRRLRPVTIFCSALLHPPEPQLNNKLCAPQLF